MNPTNVERLWAQFLKQRAPKGAKMHRYADESEQHSIAVFSGSLDPQNSLDPTRYFAATVGLSNVVQRQHGDIAVTTEIVIERRDSDEQLGNLLSTIAFYSMKDGWKISPGAVFEKLLAMYMPKTVLPHVFFTPIFQWDDMSRVALGDQTIFPLLAIPISEEESCLIGEHGASALEGRWQELQTDTSDWSRSGAV